MALNNLKANLMQTLSSQKQFLEKGGYYGKA